MHIGSEVTKDSYERVPVTAFGEEMLKGLGWQKGFGIGRDRDSLIAEPIEYIAR